ncbi:MAG TPA: acyl carrier protein [Terriglobia bacterium]|nr:acyl carrier protein [Terriglobia bacterium]
MDDVQARLAKCFTAVFPELPRSQIPAASLTSVKEWDSVATITLMTVIEEEFGLQFEPEQLEQLVSFPSILEFLRGRKDD